MDETEIFLYASNHACANIHYLANQLPVHKIAACGMVRIYPRHSEYLKVVSVYIHECLPNGIVDLAWINGEYDIRIGPKANVEAIIISGESAKVEIDKNNNSPLRGKLFECGVVGLRASADELAPQIWVKSSRKQL
jgi:hypothetical protein